MNNNKDILITLQEEYKSIKQQIKELHKKEKETLNTIQKVCTHKDTYTYTDDEYMPWNPGDEDKIVRKCKDCGKIIE